MFGEGGGDSLQCGGRATYCGHAGSVLATRARNDVFLGRNQERYLFLVWDATRSGGGLRREEDGAARGQGCRLHINLLYTQTRTSCCSDKKTKNRKAAGGGDMMMCVLALRYSLDRSCRVWKGWVEKVAERRWLRERDCGIHIHVISSLARERSRRRANLMAVGRRE